MSRTQKYKLASQSSGLDQTITMDLEGKDLKLVAIQSKMENTKWFMT